VPISTVSKSPKVFGVEPRWPALVALLAVGGLHLSLPSELTFGPDWLLLAVVAVLSVPAVVTHRIRQYAANQIFGYALSSVVTLGLIMSLALLVHALPQHKEAPIELLRSAASLWLTNILVFASWYWRLDGGGPHKRMLREVHSDGAFLFPQMMLQQGLKSKTDASGWRPNFVDYLFIAFNTSTALSPTDTAVLSRWAKGLMMVQSLISLTTIVLLAARAVNIL
jgi:hypothetical protein